MKYFPPFLLIISLFSMFSANAQDTIYYDKEGEETTVKTLAEKFKVITYSEEKGIEATERTYTITGQITAESFYGDLKKKVLVGLKTIWNENGDVRSQATYRKGKQHGNYTSYWSNGTVKRRDLYKKGKLKEGKVWDSTGVEIDYYPLMERPQFPGGQDALAKFIQANIVNPGNKKGKVVVKFVVDKTGKVTKSEIMRSEVPELNPEALRIVLSMPNWTPGKHDGDPVNVFFALPLVFQ